MKNVAYVWQSAGKDAIAVAVVGYGWSVDPGFGIIVRSADSVFRLTKHGFECGVVSLALIACKAGDRLKTGCRDA